MNDALAPPTTRRHLPPGWTFFDMVLVFAFAVFVIFLLVMVVGLLLPALGAGDRQELLREHPVVASAIVGAAVYGAFLAVTYARIVRRPNVGWSGLGFRPPPLLPMVLSPFIVTGQLLAVVMTQALVISLIGEFENPQLEAISGGQGFSWLNFVLMLVLAGGIAPLVEEILFRGLLYGWLRSRMPIILAVLLSAAIFAAAHVILPLLPALFVVGVILALAYELSGSLWLAILLHSMQNSLAVILIFTALALDLPVGT